MTREFVHEGYDHSYDAHFDYIFEAINQNLPADQIYGRLADFDDSNLSEPAAMPDLETLQKGVESEQRAAETLSQISIVKTILPATAEEDKHGIDKWIEFVPSSGHTLKPMQVKSSECGVEQFVNGPYRFVRLRRFGPIIVVNAGPKVTPGLIVAQFLYQLKEIDGYI